MNLHGYSWQLIKRIKQDTSAIHCNGTHIRMVDHLHTGDHLVITLRSASDVQPVAINVPIVYEDDDLIVYNKPYNMPVHPSHSHQTDTLANAFCAYMLAKGQPTAFHPINRLDRDTDGLCVVAKHPHAAAKLNPVKTYTAVCCGNVPSQGRIEAPICRPDRHHIIRAVGEVGVDGGQYAATNYRVIATASRDGITYSLVELSLETGRTHQIRVHMAHIGYPLAGDSMYDGDSTHIARQALSCSAVAFTHPITGADVSLSIPLPPDMSILL